MQAVFQKSRWPLLDKFVDTHCKSEICRVLNYTSSFMFSRSRKLTKESLQWSDIKFSLKGYIAGTFFCKYGIYCIGDH